MRYTKKDAERYFESLRKELGKPVAYYQDEKGQWQVNVGGWILDENFAYGGFVIHEIINTGGGVNCPFGYERLKAREFCERIGFALRVLQISKG